MQFGNQVEGELSEETKAKIQAIIEANKIVLFMKGTKEMPHCGFSDAVVKVLNFYGTEYETIDILSNPDLRSGMKIFSEWATFPQLYVNKEFIGGCDIVMDMHENGEIKAILEAA